MEDLNPPVWLKNKHSQTILASSKIRTAIIRRRARYLLNKSELLQLRTSQGIRLNASIAKPENSNGKMAIVFHGWEGSGDSHYVLNIGQVLFNQGYSIVRINFRDHGDTHHMNQTPFNSVRLDEIAEAVINLHQRFKPVNLVLCGFSLGGNFALRLAADKRISALNIEQTLSVCPAINPIDSSNMIENGSFIYHSYFMKKWRRSLGKKYQYYPEIMRSPEDLKKRKLNDMNQVFVPLHTDYDDPKTYFSAYAITQDTLNRITSPCHIVYADDDPIIPAANFDTLKETEYVTIDAQLYGGHCAFLANNKLDSWINPLLLALLASDKSTSA